MAYPLDIDDVLVQQWPRLPLAIMLRATFSSRIAHSQCKKSGRPPELERPELSSVRKQQSSYGSGRFVHSLSGQIGQLTAPEFFIVSPLRAPVPVAVRVSVKK